MTEAEALLHLAATLLPGGAGFPAFSATAAPGLLLQRLQGADQLLAALASRGALPGSPAAWVDAATRLQAVEPALFTEFRKQAYLAYYEQPEAIAAIRALGHPYNDAPLPDGYPTAPFDPPQHTPRPTRGPSTPTSSSSAPAPAAW